MADATPAAVFLSYASQDAPAVLRIAETLRAAGVEVWFDQNELVGGDAWDQKIRRQIKECALFVPVISAATQARTEGYFRLEWRLADQRTHLMAKGRPFLLPVVIDDTRDSEAHVPDSFTEVQWTRLPAGETTPAFCARVKKLLGGDAAVAGSEVGARVVRAQEDRRGPAAPLHKPTRPWLVPTIIGVAAVGALAFWQPWRAKEKPASPPATNAAPPALSQSNGLTEAQQLVAKARKIFDEGDELNRETYVLAEDVLKKAEALDVTEAAAWALHAHLSSRMIHFGLDGSTARFEAMRAQADRALRLAPGALPAELAAAETQEKFHEGSPEVERMFRRLAEKYPNDRQVLRGLATACLTVGKVNESLDALKRALRLQPDDPRLKTDVINCLVQGGRWAEAEETIRHYLAGKTCARLLTYQIYLKLNWTGDLTNAPAAMQEWPAWYFLEDRGAGHAAIAALWSRDPARALEIAQRFPRDYLRDYFYTGPRAVLTAWAHEQAQHGDAARAEWRIALQVTERELAAAPDDATALHWKAWALARLGDAAAAKVILRQLEEREVKVGNLPQITGGLGGLALAVGQMDDAFVQIGRIRQGYIDSMRAITKTTYRLNPVFDPLRGDTRFQALIDAAPGPEEKKESATASGAAAPDPKSVAVLAFANLSDDKGNEYFSDGISEELLNVLAKVPKLKVAARTSSFYFKSRNEPIPEIAQKLGVAYVVEGSVRKAGNKVRITAQLIKAADGFHVWSETYDRELTDIFRVQDEIAKNILGVVRGSILGEADLPHATTTKPEAYALFLQAQGQLATRAQPSMFEAERLFVAALAIDPDYVPALVGLARTRFLLPTYASMAGPRARAAFAGAKQAAQHALELEPRNAGALAAHGSVLSMGEWRWAEGEAELLRARELAPNDAWVANMIGDHFLFTGNSPETLAAKRHWRELDPLSAPSHWDLGYACLVARDYDQAIRWGERARELAPHNLNPYTVIALAAGRSGRFDLMRQTLAAAGREVQGDEDLRLLDAALCAIMENRTDEARRLLAQVTPLAEKGEASPAYLGYCYLRLGESEKARAWLQRAYDLHDGALGWAMNIDFADIAADPLTRPLLDQPGLKELYDIRQRNARAGQP